MADTVVIVNGEALEGVAKQNIATTKRNFDVSDITARYTTHTDTFHAPFTATNHRILANSHNANSETTFPYRKQNVNILQGGVQTLTNGVLTVRRCNGFYELYVVAGSAGFFNAIGTKKLWDLTGFKQAFHDAGTYRNTTSGLVHPVCYTGYLSTGNYEMAAVPFWYYKDVLDRIFSDAGYTKSGSILSSSKYLNMIVNASGSKVGYEPRFSSVRSASVIADTPQTVNLNGSAGLEYINFTNVKKGGDNVLGYWDGTSKYQANDPDVPAGAIVFDVNVKVNLNVTIPSGKQVRFRLIAAGVVIDDIITINGTGAPQNIDYDFVAKNAVNTGGYSVIPPYVRNGTAYDVSVQAQQLLSGIPMTMTVNSGSIAITPMSRPSTGDGVIATWAYYAQLLPDITQLDFIKDFSVRFGLLMSESDNGDLNFRTLGEVLSDLSSAIDLTSKRVNIDEDISFTPLAYAKKNNFIYKTSDDFGAAAAGDGLFLIDNDNITSEVTIFTSPFSKTADILAIGTITSAYVPVLTGDPIQHPNYWNEEPGARILLVRDKYSYEPNYPAGGLGGSYKVAYFIDSKQADTMSLQESLDRYYPLFTAALQKAKLAIRIYMINQADFNNIDFTAFDKDSFFIVNQVINFIPEKQTQIELLKI